MNTNNNINHKSKNKLKAEQLDNSNLYDIHLHSQYKEINNLRDELFLFFCVHDSQFKLKNESKNKAQIKNLIINLYKTYHEDPTKYVAVSLGKTYYSKHKARYNELFIKYIIVPAIHLLHKHDYIEFEPGFKNRVTGKGKNTRIRAAEKLIDLFINRSLHIYMIQRSLDTEVIIMKDAKVKNEINYKDTDETERMRAILWKYNHLLDKTYIDIPSRSEFGIQVRKDKNSKELKTIHTHQSNKFVYRVFNNNNWNDGGRFYGGWWQIIPREERRGIHFWNMPTSEIDYSALHIKLLYLKFKIDLNNDPYIIPGIEHNEINRAIIKLILLNIINAEDPEGNDKLALKAIQGSINKNNYLSTSIKENNIKWRPFLPLIKNHHKKIKKHFNTGVGIELQGLDSKIAESVIEHFTQKDIPVLCIHDSFVIASDKVSELNTVMQEKFIKIISELGYKTKGNDVKFKGLVEGEFQDLLTRPELKDRLIDSFINTEYQYPVWSSKMKEFKEKYISGFCTTI